MFTPLRTRRLVIRPFGPNDAAELAARRSDPEVARYQNWEIPYPIERAKRMIAELMAMDGPENEEWWMAVVCDAATGATLGDLAVNLTWEGKTAEVGYTFARKHWGKGFAVEAVGAFVDYLFDLGGVTRIFGMLHPENIASAMVLERTGFLFEGHTRFSYWVGTEVSDDWIYGITRHDRQQWRNRIRTRPEHVSLIEITAENVAVVSRLQTHKSQESFVAPMGRSFTDALVPEVVDGAPVVPWMRAVLADGEVVGFVMLAERTEDHAEPYLWRLLIDRLHQRRGIGGLTLALVEAECFAAGSDTLLTSWGSGKGSPEPFYLNHGFVPTGRFIDDEIEGRKSLG